ncbi:hypothetical protein M758_3G245500 [Ceratodon purpureus]|uniref:Rieske domain-containing protein n=1 Tax=Ceratodon purpureus TaxID=3225 RepID=A0A8T0IPL5_CERPU|nr:hypothetical protein KC19_3G245100 [Ceratodon purpureus]KAG0624410.1 hypothetical protein M758_3G245500 [Ceratodon purpureus]
MADYFGQIEQGVTDRFGQGAGNMVGQFGQQFGGGQPAGLSQWGSASTYSVKNLSTGMYLAAHPDGQLVAEDDTTGHHDVPWSIFSTGDGRVALKSCHGKYLDTDESSGLPTNNSQDPNQVTWELAEQGNGVYSLGAPDGQYLQAVPPNGEEQQVLLTNQCGQSESWQIEPMSSVTGAIDNAEGRFF